MRLEDIYVRGTGLRLPERLSAAEAVDRGAYDQRLARSAGVVSVAYSPEESAAEMAVVAAREALRRADSGPADVDLLLHADTYHQGHDLWPVASYVQRESGGGQCPAIEIRQMSNGGMAALDLASAYLTAARSRCDALLTTADRFAPPGIDRWRTDPGTPYADGATALVLSRRGGYARLVSLSVFADPELEPMHRGTDPFSHAPLQQRTPVDFEGAKKSFLAEHGLSFTVSRTAAGQRSVIKEALADAGMELADADWVILPHFGQRRLTSLYYQPYGIDPARTTWEWNRTVGHLGAGDQFASLHHLVRTGQVAAGERLVLIGVGAGYSWGCAVVEMLQPPPWSGAL